MATPVVFNGVNYSVPAFGDVGYAQGPGNLSSYLIAIASGTFQTTGGLFSLTADADFGPNFGLVSIYYKTASANIATAGQFRLAVTDTIQWRNNANSANLPLGVNGSDQLTFNSVVLSTAAIAGTVNAGTAGRLTLYPAAGNTVDDIYVQNSQNIDVLIATQAARSVALEYTIPNPGNAVAAATFALLELAQTFTAAQTFAATVTISATTNQLILGTTNTVTITSPAPAASRVYTIPDVLGASDFVMTAGAQTVTGIKTFSGGAGAVTMSGSTIAMGANKITGLANGTVSTDAAAFGQISGTRILQIVTAYNQASFSTTSSTFQTTNITASITPASTASKIFVFARSNTSPGGPTTPACITIFRGATNLGEGTSGMAQNGIVSSVAATGIMHTSLFYLDSPASVSSLTYSVKLRNGNNLGGGSTVYCPPPTNTTTNPDLGQTAMILVEVG